MGKRLLMNSMDLAIIILYSKSVKFYITLYYTLYASHLILHYIVLYIICFTSYLHLLQIPPELGYLFHDMTRRTFKLEDTLLDPHLVVTQRGVYLPDLIRFVLRNSSRLVDR